MDSPDEWAAETEWIAEVRHARAQGRHETDIEHDLLREGKFSDSSEAHRFVEFVRAGALGDTPTTSSDTLLNDLLPTVQILGGVALFGLALLGGSELLTNPSEMEREMDDYSGEGIVGILIAVGLGISLLRAGIRNLFTK